MINFFFTMLVSVFVFCSTNRDKRDFRFRACVDSLVFFIIIRNFKFNTFHFMELEPMAELVYSKSGKFGSQLETVLRI